MSCSFPNTHTTQNQSQDSIDSIQDSHNTQGQPIIYLLNCENRKTYPIALQANTDSSGNIMQDKADNTSYNAILSTELNLDMKATTKLILSCNDLVAQHYSTYDIHKITGVGIVSVNYDLKQKAKKGESIIYKNVLQLKQTTTLDEMITNTDSILEVKIHNTQKPLRIDTTLECEALYYGYNLIQWAYVILPTKEYNPHKTKLQKDIDYYELPSDTYKGNIITFNPREYLQQAHNNTLSNQPNAKDNPLNYSQQLRYLTQGDYTLVIFAYQKTPAYKVKNYTTHTKLDYNPPLSLRFNGKALQIVEWGEVKKDSPDSKQYDKNRIFIARSGKPLSIDSQTNQDSATQHNTDSLILNPDNAQEYFEYSKQRQKDKDKGAIPEGIYYIDITQSKDNKQSGIREYNNAWYSFSRSKEGEKQWGKYNIPIYTDKDCTNTTESSTKRQGFYIHGGESYGDNGGIDLSKEDNRFFNTLESLKQEYKEVLESIKDDKGRIIIKLEVEYEERKSEIDLRGKRTPNGGVVEWISQFDSTKEGMGAKAGNTACFATCYEILQRSKLGSVSGYKTNQYIVATEKGLDLKQDSQGRVNISAPILQGTQVSKIDGNFDTTRQSEYIKITHEAKDGIAYLDSELESGYPVLVGVDHTYDKRIHNNRDRYNAPDYATDHYIVIVGRGYDTKGLFYRFYDVGTRYKNKGISDENKLYLKADNSLRGTSEVINRKTNKQYEFVVTQIRKNKH